MFCRDKRSGIACLFSPCPGASVAGTKPQLKLVGSSSGTTRVAADAGLFQSFDTANDAIHYSGSKRLAVKADAGFVAAFSILVRGQDVADPFVSEAANGRIMRAGDLTCLLFCVQAQLRCHFAGHSKDDEFAEAKGSAMGLGRIQLFDKVLNGGLVQSIFRAAGLHKIGVWLALGQGDCFGVISESFYVVRLELFPGAPGDDAHLAAITFGAFPVAAGIVWRNGRLVAFGAVVIHCRNVMPDQRLDSSLEMSGPIA